MKLLIVMKLLDSSLENMIRPLSMMDEVTHIDIIRDMPGPAIPKVVYRCPPAWAVRFAPLGILLKLVHAIALSVRGRPDLVLGFFMWPHGIIAFLTAKLTRRPVSLSMISHTEMDAMGPRFSGLHVRILRWSDIVTVTGSRTREKLEMFGVQGEKLFVLPHVVDLRRFSPRDVGKTYDLIYLGRIGPRKHVDMVLKVGQRLKASGFPDIRICIAGKIDDQAYYQHLVAQREELGMTGNVDLAGPVEDPALYYNRSRIFILPSGGEGLPFTLLEAMACGVPVVVSGVGDIPDVARDLENALVIRDYSDMEAFVQAAARILRSPELAQRLRENGLREVTGIHTTENVQETWKGIFAQVRSRARPADAPGRG